MTRNSSNKKSVARNQISLDDVLEDLFGLSFRAIATLITLFNRPADYYAAVFEKDWGGRFTPSMRMWLSLFALLSFLQFIWLRTDSPLVANIASDIVDSGFDLPIGMTADELGQKVYVTAYTAYPVFALIGLTLGGMLYPFWGTGHTSATRVRSTFATLIPSSIAMLLLLILTIRLSPDQMVTFILLAPVISGLFDFTTSVRGAFPSSGIVIRIFRAFGLAGWVFLLTTGCSVLSGVFALAIVDIQTGVPLIFRGG
ncbi:MAG: hypothetical protein AAFR03_12455 [Pseudomonadota bacterium]